MKKRGELTTFVFLLMRFARVYAHDDKNTCFYYRVMLMTKRVNTTSTRVPIMLVLLFVSLAVTTAMERANKWARENLDGEISAELPSYRIS